MIDVECDLPVYEINGADVDISVNQLIMSSHWNHNDRVKLKVGDTMYTLIAKDLKAALDNCTNTAKY